MAGRGGEEEERSARIRKNVDQKWERNLDNWWIIDIRRMLGGGRMQMNDIRHQYAPRKLNYSVDETVLVVIPDEVELGHWFNALQSYGISWPLCFMILFGLMRVCFTCTNVNGRIVLAITVSLHLKSRFMIFLLIFQSFYIMIKIDESIVLSCTKSNIFY